MDASRVKARARRTSPVRGTVGQSVTAKQPQECGTLTIEEGGGNGGNGDNGNGGNGDNGNGGNGDNGNGGNGENGNGGIADGLPVRLLGLLAVLLLVGYVAMN